MSVLTLPGIRHLGMAGLRALSTAPYKSTRDLDEVAAIYDTFKDKRARQAIRHVVRAVVDWQGQIVTMADRAYLAEEMPMWVVWGRDDRVIPVRHANAAAAIAPNARVEVIRTPGTSRTRTTGAVRPDRARLRPHHRAGEVQPGAVPRAAQGRADRVRAALGLHHGVDTPQGGDHGHRPVYVSGVSRRLLRNLLNHRGR